MIVDASVAVKWVVFEDGSEEALDLLDRHLAAPSIWLAEAANALRSKCARGELGEDEASEFARDLADAPVASLDLRDLLPMAIGIRSASAAARARSRSRTPQPESPITSSGPGTGKAATGRPEASA
jgi:predicted nucleic acid-binding protein